MLLLFGVIDFGRIFHVLIAISNAAREGARYGVMFTQLTKA
jgi:Flp pilus assembly protein TadG